MNDNFNPYTPSTTDVSKNTGYASDGNADLAVLEPLAKVTKWTKFVGVMFIIFGILSALSIWGIIFAWLPIWMGVMLNKHSNLLEKGYQTNNEIMCKESMAKLSTFFKIFGAIMVLYVAFFVIAIIAAIAIPNLLATRGA